MLDVAPARYPSSVLVTPDADTSPPAPDTSARSAASSAAVSDPETASPLALKRALSVPLQVMASKPTPGLKMPVGSELLKVNEGALTLPNPCSTSCGGLASRAPFPG